MKTEVEDVGLDVKDVKTEVADVKTQVEYARLDVKDVKTQVEDIGSAVKELKLDVADIKQAMHAESSKGSPFPNSCIPDRIPHFVGRQKECQAILDHLKIRDTRLVDVWGPPGFGKTSVAINVAHHLGEMKIPVYFASLRGMESKDDLVSKMLSLFTDMKHAPHMSPSHWLIQSLQQLNSPFVLILDNADDLLESGNANLKEDVLRFIEDILAQCNFIRLLITSRESLDYLSHKLPIHLERVGVLNEVASNDLVKSLLPDVSEPGRNSVVKACGQVPLAMRLMCRTVTEQHVSVSELLEELKLSPLVKVLDNDSFYGDVRLKTIISTSFQRLTVNEKDSFVSLAVFPGCFGIYEAMSVLNLGTLPQTKKVIRSLERKSLIDCSKNFASFTIHSLLRSFIDERRTTHQETEAVFLTAQRRFYDYHISSFEAANGMFLTGYSNKALVAFLDRRESIILSLSNGTTDDELYSKVVDVLSKAELFLYAILPNEEFLFKTIYDTAVNEAHRRKNVDDERKLLAAKSLGHWGWFSSNRPTWDHSLQEGCANADHCPTKLLCYFGVHQILCGKLEEGISTLKRSVECLVSSCDETILKLLVYQILAIGYWKKQEHKMASRFMDLFRVEASAGTGLIPSKDTWPSMANDAFLFHVTNDLLFLSIKGKAIYSRAFRAMPAFFKNSLPFLQSFLPESQAKFLVNLLRKPVSLLQCELEEPEHITFKFAVALKRLFSFCEHISPNSFSITSLNHFIEEALYFLESMPSVGGLSQLYGNYLAGILKELLTTVGNYVDSHRNNCRVDFEAFARTCDTFGKLLHFIEDYSGALKMHRQAITVREENIGDHVDTASSLKCIGCLFFKMNNESEAVESFQNALKLRKQLGVYDHADTANIFYALAENYFALGNYKKAIEAHLQSLELQNKHLGKHPITGETLHKLATIHFRMGEAENQSVKRCHNLPESPFQLEGYRKAREFCQKALTMRRDLLGEHVDTANSFHFLGEVHYKMGNFSSAVEAFQRASSMRSNLLGDHEDTALSYHRLGLAQCGMGDLEKALESLQNALQLNKKCSIEYHPGVADIIDDIGGVYCKMGDYQSAREQFQDAVNLYRKFVDNHERTANSCQKLAVTYLAMKSYPEALENCQQALNMKRELLGEHVNTAGSFQVLGYIHFRIGNFSSAVEAFQKASDMGSNLLGDHEDTALSYHWLGQSQCKMGHLTKALESLKRALQMKKKCSKGDHLDIANSSNSIGRVYLKMGDYQSAREHLQDAVDLYKRLLDKHESTANSCHNLAITYFAMKSYPESLENCQQALNMKRELLGEHVNTAGSFQVLGYIHFKIGNFSSAVEAFQKASDMRSNLLGDHEDTALSYHWLGQSQCKMGHLTKALESLKRALQMKKKCSKGDHLDIANSSNSIGHVYHKMGDYQSAREHFQDAVDLYIKLLDEHESTATSCHNLAVTYFAMKSYAEALEFCQQALTMRLELLGEHVDTAKAFHFLGEIHYKMRDFPSAVEAFQKASDMRSNLLGGHVDTALSLHWLGLARSDMGHLDKALESWQQGLNMSRELLGEHVNTAERFHVLGDIHFKMGDFSSAVEAFQRASDMRSNLLGDREDTALSYHWLGLAQTNTGNSTKALESLQHALQMRKKCSIVDHPGIADTIRGIGVVYLKMGDYQSAREQFQDAVNLYKKLPGKHEATANTCHRLAVTCIALGSFFAALEFYQEALTMRFELLGEHVDTAESFHILGEVHYNMCDLPSAVEAFQKASDMRLNLLGDHENTARSFHLLGLAQCDMDDQEKALKSLQTALQIRKKCLIADHPGIADSIHGIGVVYLKMDDYQSAREHFHDAVDLFKKVLDKHERTANSYHNLAVTYLAMESYPEALEMCQQAVAIRRELLGEHVDTAESFHILGRVV